MANLLPQKLQRETRQERRARAAIVICILLLTVEILGSVALVPPVLLARSKRRSTVSQLGTVEKLVSRQESENVTAEVRTTRNQLAELATLRHHVPVAVDIAALTRQVGSDVRVNSIVYQSIPVVVHESDESPPTAKTTTVTVRGTATTRETLLTFVKSLEHDPRFVRVDLPVSNLATRTNIPFSLTITLANTE